MSNDSDARAGDPGPRPVPGRSAVSNDSDARAGDPLDPGRTRPFTEADAIQPDTPYGRSKLEAEKLVLEGGHVPEGVVLRLAKLTGSAWFTSDKIQTMLAFNPEWNLERSLPAMVDRCCSGGL